MKKNVSLADVRIGAKRIAVPVLLGMVLVLGLLVTGCSNEAQEITGSVSINYPQLGEPSITAEKTADNQYVILRWRAVSNASDYSVYQQRNGAVNPVSVGISPTNSVIFDIEGGETSNSDEDAWNVKLPLTVALGITPGTDVYRYGIRSDDALIHGGAQIGSSNIAWTGYEYTLTANPWTKLLGTWKHEGPGDQPEYRFVLSGGSSIRWGVYNSTSLSPDYQGTISSSNISSSTTVYFSDTLDYYNSFTTTIIGGKLVVSDLNSYTEYNGSYTKQ